ncbi:MAG: 50S ribosomal protein L10 [Planctomycetes bacterium]|nr:50S ribosomal protein L10 [Planctomycetota bacterium]
MPNILNKQMLTEIEGLLVRSSDCVIVDFTGMSVADAENMRGLLRSRQMDMQVLKSSLARLAAQNVGLAGAEDLFRGSAAVVYGGESVAAVARTVKDLARARRKPVVRGGLLDRKAIGPEQVEVLARLPGREELLAQVVGTIVAPLSGAAGAINALLAAVPGLTKALEDKLNEGGAAAG